MQKATATQEMRQVLWLAVIILSMLTAFGPICTDIYLPAIPAITQELKTDPATIQLSLTTCFLGLALGQLFVGPISDAFGRKVPLYFCLILFVISSIACAYAPSAGALIVARLFQGLAGAGGIVLSRAMACDMYHGSELTKFMSLLMTINSLAPILGPIIGSAIVTYLDWPALFLFLAIWGMALLSLSYRGINETLPAEKRNPKLMDTVKDMLGQLLNKRFLSMCLSLSFIMGGFFGYLAASPFVFQSIYGFSALGYSIIFAVNALMITIAAQLAGRLSHRLGDSNIVVGSLVVQLVASGFLLFLAFIVPENPIFVGLALCAYVAMLGSSQCAGFGLVMEARSGGAGTASGIFGVLTFLFGALCSPLVGLMGEMSMLPLALCMLVCTILSYICFKIGSKSQQSSSHLYSLAQDGQIVDFEQAHNNLDNQESAFAKDENAQVEAVNQNQAQSNFEKIATVPQTATEEENKA